MPNWAHNTLTVTGPREQLEAFVEKAKVSHANAVSDYENWPKYDEDSKPATLEEYEIQLAEKQPLTFAAFVPEPPENRIGENWYHWRITNWGTKWDASFGEPFIGLSTGEGSDIEKSVEAKGATVTKDTLVYKFDTAWSPPTPVVVAMGEQHPELEFVLRFGEPGGGYAGELNVEGSEVIETVLELDDVLAPEEMWF